MFDNEDAAQSALMALAGRLFLDRVVVGTFATQDQLDSAIERAAELPPSEFPNLTTALVNTASVT